MNFAALCLEQSQKRCLIAQPRIVAGENISRWTFVLWFLDRPPGFQVKVFQKELALAIEIVERDQQRSLFVVIIVSL